MLCERSRVPESLDRLVEYSRNPRKNDAAIGRMVASILELGFQIRASSEVTVRSERHRNHRTYRQRELRDICRAVTKVTEVHHYSK